MPGFNVAQRDGRVKTRNFRANSPECVHDVPRRGTKGRTDEFPGGAGCLRGTAVQVGRVTEVNRVSTGCQETSFSRRFGEPLPGLVTTPVVAPPVRAVATCAGVAEVWPAR